MAELKISELNYVPQNVSLDSMEIPIDNGQSTYRVTVSEFNERGTTSAQNYASQAATSATDALAYKNAAETASALALSYKNSAISAKESAETAEGNALSYKNAAESAKNDAVSAAATINTAASTVAADVVAAETAATNAASAKTAAETAASNANSYKNTAVIYAEDSEAWARGTIGGTELPSGADQYQNNSKWYAEQAASSASSAASDAQTCATSVVKTPYIGANGHWYVWSWENQAFVDTNINATGPTGNGIASLEKTGTSGKVDTYTITFTDGTTFSYTVTNGEDGQGSGDMLASDYDAQGTVHDAGGIPTYVSGAITAGITGKMNTNGSNAAAEVKMDSNHIVGVNDYNYWTIDSLTKASGDNQDLIIVETFSASTREQLIINSGNLTGFYMSHVGDTLYYLENDEEVYFIIDSVSSSYNDPSNPTQITYTVTAHLVEDVSDAISKSGIRLYYTNYIGSTDKGNSINGNYSSIKGSGIVNGRSCFIAASNGYAEGKFTAILANGGHAEGEKTTVGGFCGHAEGKDNYANAYCHVEGTNNAATGEASHVEGRYNNADYPNQHVSGKYNSNKSTTLFEVGNGTAENARSNAFEIYSDGYISQNDGTDKYKFAKSGGLDGFYDGSGTFHPLVNLYLEQNVTLSTSADVTVTFTDDRITADSVIDVYTNSANLTYDTMSITNGSCSVTFAKQSSASVITVRIYIK